MLLPGGRTAHKRFNLPLDPVDGAEGNIARGTQAGDLMLEVALIIWDETTMMHREHFDIVDRNLRDLREKVVVRRADPTTGQKELLGGACPFGGVPVVLGGDFQQILPVVPKGNRADTVASSVLHAGIWSKLTHLYLRKNMRLDSASPRNRPLAEWLCYMSHDPVYHGRIHLPDVINTTSNMEAFLQAVYPTHDLAAAPANPDILASRAILSPRNVFVHDINNILLDRTPGTTHPLYAVDSCVMEDEDFVDACDITPEFLNSINASGLPLAHLRLKVCVLH